MLFSNIVLIVPVGLAGALGALTRYLLGCFISEYASLQFPLGTLLINITGAFVIGLLLALTTHKTITISTQLILATGFLGGYTTFSTMCWEGNQLLRSASWRFSMLYLGGTLAGGLLAAVLGLSLGGLL
ncbi:MAG TPA: fluoride efflux transporter CrcB [Ktedonobacteraceae bacterium]|jgi:CrcB protein